jgi:hypothetical protein
VAVDPEAAARVDRPHEISVEAEGPDTDSGPFPLRMQKRSRRRQMWGILVRSREGKMEIPVYMRGNEMKFKAFVLAALTAFMVFPLWAQNTRHTCNTCGANEHRSAQSRVGFDTAPKPVVRIPKTAPKTSPAGQPASAYHPSPTVHHPTPNVPSPHNPNPRHDADVQRGYDANQKRNGK